MNQIGNKRNQTTESSDDDEWGPRPSTNSISRHGSNRSRKSVASIKFRRNQSRRGRKVSEKSSQSSRSLSKRSIQKKKSRVPSTIKSAKRMGTKSRNSSKKNERQRRATVTNGGKYDRKNVVFNSTYVNPTRRDSLSSRKKKDRSRRNSINGRRQRTQSTPGRRNNNNLVNKSRTFKKPSYQKDIENSGEESNTDSYHDSSVFENTWDFDVSNRSLNRMQQSRNRSSRQSTPGTINASIPTPRRYNIEFGNTPQNFARRTNVPMFPEAPRWMSNRQIYEAMRQAQNNNNANRGLTYDELLEIPPSPRYASPNSSLVSIPLTPARPQQLVYSDDSEDDSSISEASNRGSTYVRQNPELFNASYSSDYSTSDASKNSFSSHKRDDLPSVSQNGTPNWQSKLPSVSLFKTPSSKCRSRTKLPRGNGNPRITPLVSPHSRHQILHTMESTPRLGIHREHKSFNNGAHIVDFPFALTADPPEAIIPASGGRSYHYLINNSQSRLAFKVKCSYPMDYYQIPTYGIIEVGKSVPLEIIRLDGTPKKNYYSIIFLEVASNVTDPNDLFENDPNAQYDEIPDAADILIIPVTAT